jgi:hypothetical protein
VHNRLSPFLPLQSQPPPSFYPDLVLRPPFAVRVDLASLTGWLFGSLAFAQGSTCLGVCRRGWWWLSGVGLGGARSRRRWQRGRLCRRRLKGLGECVTVWLFSFFRFVACWAYGDG